MLLEIINRENRKTVEGKYREKILGKVILEWNGERLFIDEKEIS